MCGFFFLFYCVRGVIIRFVRFMECSAEFYIEIVHEADRWMFSGLRNWLYRGTLSRSRWAMFSVGCDDGGSICDISRCENSLPVTQNAVVKWPWRPQSRAPASPPSRKAPSSELECSACASRARRCRV